jgi:hypothetical protein
MNGITEEIIKGGLVIAPCNIGKTSSIIELLKSGLGYLMVVRNDVERDYIRDKYGVRDVISSFEYIGFEDGFRDKKVIVDECFSNDAFGSVWHCAIGVCDSRVILFDTVGNRLECEGASLWVGNELV